MKETIAALTKALESRAAALLIAVLVLFGGYNLASQAVESLASKLDVVSRELGGASCHAERLGVARCQ